MNRRVVWYSAMVVAILFTSAHLCLSQVPAKPSPSPQEKLQPPPATVQTVEQAFPRPLLRAIVRKEYVTVSVLLANGDKPDVPDGSTFMTTPILLAADVGELQIIDLLLKAGARINARDDMGITPLIVAAVRGRATTIDFLLTHGADPNSQTASGGTALMAAAGEGNLEVVKRLLKAEAKVNTATDRGVTALMGAADDAELVEALIDAGADLDLTDSNGWTAVCHAYRKDQLKKLAVLKKRGAKQDVEQCPQNK